MSQEFSAKDIREAGGLAKFIEKLERTPLKKSSEKSAPKSKKEPSVASFLSSGTPTEEEEQSALISWAAAMSARFPELRLLLHIPNGGARHRAVAAKLTAQGVRRGVPDLFLPVRRGPYGGLWIEMKRSKGGVASPEQKQWLKDLNDQGFRTALCHGCESAVQEICGYLGIGGEKEINF